jgi:hypothetical protein
MSDVNKDMLITMYKHMLLEDNVKCLTYHDIKSDYQDASVIHTTLEVNVCRQGDSYSIYLTSSNNFGLESDGIDTMDAIKFPLTKNEYDDLFTPTDIKYQTILKEQKRIMDEKMELIKKDRSRKRDEYVFNIYDNIINNKISDIISKKS